MKFNDFPKFALDNNYFVLGVGDKICSEDLAKRIYKVSLEKCTPSFLARVEEAKKYFPLIFISFRLYKRAWVSQIDGLANIIRKLSVDYPELGVVFDGFSLADCHVDMEGGYPSFVKAQIEQEKDVVKQILSLLPDQKVGIYDAVGCRLHESIIWAYAVDFQISSMGANLVKSCTLANKPGIAHGSNAYTKLAAKPWWNEPRENGVNPTFISADRIVDIDPDIGANSNYDCDWQVIYDEVMKLLPKLSRK